MAKRKTPTPMPAKLAQEYAQCTAAGRYDRLCASREHYLIRARDCSSLTIPALIPRDGFGPTSFLPTPYQSVGASGVTSLASKLVLALFPPNTPFFRFYIPEEVVREMLGNTPDMSPAALAEIDRALSKGERKIMWEFETQALRSKVHEAVEHLIVAGNALVYFPAKRTPQVFHLNQYVCRRSPSGEVLEIVVKEAISWGALPAAIREKLPTVEGADEKEYALYTRIHRPSIDDDFQHYQEVEGFIVPNSEGIYRKGKPMPWLPLRWRTIDGESYGRAFCEEYLGDLASLESLVKSTVIGAAASSKVLFLVKPNSTTRIKTLVDAPSGAVREGNPDDVGVLQVQKHADMQMAISLAETIESRLNEAFLRTSSVTRNAERVTATEIQLLAQELEDTLGGVYTLLSQELQRPVVTILMHGMKRDGKLSLPQEALEVHILTGLEALGRTADLRRLDTFIQGANEMFGPQVVAQYVSPGEYFRRRAAALAIDTGGLVRTEQEVQAANEAAQKAQSMAAIAPNMIAAAPQMQRNVAEAEANGVAPSGSTEALMNAAVAQLSTP